VRAARCEAGDQQRSGTTEAGDLFLPLALQRRGTHHQHTRNIVEPSFGPLKSLLSAGKLFTRSASRFQGDTNVFHEAGAEPKPTLETNSISTLITHVRDGPWSSVMAHAWLHAFDVPRGMTVIPLVEPATTRTIGLVWLDRDPEPILARALLEVASGVDLGRALSR